VHDYDETVDNLPTDFLTERSLLATLCAAGNEKAAADIAFTLEEAAFLAPAHRAIYRALASIVKDPGAEVNAVVLKHALERDDALRTVGGYSGLVEILSADEVGKPEVLANRLRDLLTMRRLIALGHRITMDASRREQDASELLRTVSESLTVLASDGSYSGLRRGSDILDLVREGKPLRVRSKGKLAWLGLPPFDDAIEATAGQVVILAARPGVGKTGLLVQGSLETAKRGERPLIVSLEMSTEELQARAAAMLTGATVRAFRDGDYHSEDAGRLWHFQGVLDRWLVLDLPSGTPWNEIEAAIRHAHRVHGITSVWIDYFTLIRIPHGSKQSSDATRWSDLVRSITRMTKQLGVCTVLLSQLRKENAGIEPTDADLRETGQLEQDAYSILMLWFKDQKSHEEHHAEREVWCKIAKNRQGPSGFKRLLMFNGAINKFTVVERVTTSEPQPRHARLGY
jgi:replicative DNA helicase